MSSKAWFKTAAPRLIRKFAHDGIPRRRSVEIWTTTCIVSGFKSANCSSLINPANPSLSGPHKFPYFPRGGPEPKQQPKKDAHHIMGYVSQWGGMEVGGGMMFAASVVDGMVHQLGGTRLRAECKFKALAALARGQRDACPVGTAVATGPGGQELRLKYDGIIHTVPPFFAHHSTDDDVVELLRSCYQASFDIAFDGAYGSEETRVAIPLLGAGCRGFPLDIALQVAVDESCRWMIESTLEQSDTSTEAKTLSMSNDDERKTKETLAFGFLEETIAQKFVSAVEESPIYDGKQ